MPIDSFSTDKVGFGPSDRIISGCDIGEAVNRRLGRTDERLGATSLTLDQCDLDGLAV
jgi:hypothetical protein